MYNILKTRMG